MMEKICKYFSRTKQNNITDLDDAIENTTKIINKLSTSFNKIKETHNKKAISSFKKDIGECKSSLELCKTKIDNFVGNDITDQKKKYDEIFILFSDIEREFNAIENEPF